MKLGYGLAALAALGVVVSGVGAFLGFEGGSYFLVGINLLCLVINAFLVYFNLRKWR